MNRALHAEWIKLSTVRRTWTFLAVIFALNVLQLVLGVVLFNRNIGGDTPDTSIANRIETIVEPVTGIAILGAAFGVMVATGDLRHRTIIPSLVVSPRREELLAAKAIVTGAIAAVFVALTLAINVVAGMITLDNRGFPLSFGDDDYIRVLVGTAVFFILTVLFGVAVGAIVANLALGIAIVIFVPLAVESLIGRFLPDWSEEALPFHAAQALYQLPNPTSLNPWEGGGVMFAWVLGLVIIGGIMFQRRDLGTV